VFNTLAIYIVGAWAALQVAEPAFTALGILEQAIRYVWIGVSLLIPIQKAIPNRVRLPHSLGLSLDG
jgi:hypothetical protein